MLTSVRIRNYRSFADVELSDLRRVNLIAGKNNSGKTSLLEAIFLGGYGNRPEILLNSNVLRPYGSQDEEEESAGGLNALGIYWPLLFRELRVTVPIEISFDDDALGHYAMSTALTDVTDPEDANESVRIAHDTDTITHAQNLILTNVDQEGQRRESRIVVSDDGVKIELGDGPNPDYPRNIVILQQGRGLNLSEISEVGKMRVSRETQQLLSALQIIEPKLVAIEENSATGSPAIWGDIGLSELVPLHVMGGGMTRTARIILAMRKVRGGILLLDEVENGLHHSVLRNFWRAIDQAADQLDVQLFATTHSLECIKAATAVLDDEQLSVHRLEEIGGSICPVRYERDVLEASFKMGLEVR